MSLCGPLTLLTDFSGSSGGSFGADRSPPTSELSADEQAELNRVVEPLKAEVDSRRAGFREYVREGLYARLSAEVQQAGHAGRKAPAQHLCCYEKVPWATLRAAVRRDGRFSGARDVNLPQELTLIFEEPIAVAWSEKVLGEVQERVGLLAKRYGAAVEAIAQWAQNSGLQAHASILRVVHDELTGANEQIAVMLEEELAKARESVSLELYREIEAAVASACAGFVDERKDVGAGVKTRLLDLLEQMAEEVTDKAIPTAERVLRQHLATMVEQVAQEIGGLGNPAEHARDALITQAEAAVQRSAAANRQVQEQCTDLLTDLERLRVEDTAEAAE